MAVIVEPERSDPWLGYFHAPGMTYCVLRDDADDADSERSEGWRGDVTDGSGRGRDGSGAGAGDALEEVTSRLVRQSGVSGSSWVAHLSGPLDEVTAALQLTGRAAERRPLGDSLDPPAGIPARATLVLRPDDPALAELIESEAGGHGTLALIQVRGEAIATVLGALERGDDLGALADADRVVVQQPALHRTTFAVRAPDGGGRAAAPVATRTAPPPRRHLAFPLLVALAAGALAVGVGMLIAGQVGRSSTPSSSAPATAPARPAVLPPLPSAAPVGTTVASAPPPRTGASAIFDADRGSSVVFGGSDPSGAVLGDTWVFDGHAWTLAHPARTAPPRTAAAITDDPGIHEVVMFGGIAPDGSKLDDTWIWDGSIWKNLVPTRDRPAAGPPLGLTFDDARGELVLVVSATSTPTTAAVAQTWTWAGTTWGQLVTPNSPVLTTSTSMAYDPQTQRTVLVDAASNATWLFDGITWIRQDAPGLGLDTATPTHLTFDPQAGGMLLVQSAGPGRGLSSTWTYDGASWKRVTAPSAPDTVAGLVTDKVAGRPVALAGPLVSTDLSEVWSWRLGAWGP